MTVYLTQNLLGSMYYDIYINQKSRLVKLKFKACFYIQLMILLQIFYHFIEMAV